MISLAINSKNPRLDWFNQLLESAQGFDETLIFIDGNGTSIKDGFNQIIKATRGDWVCSFCDDDFFHVEHLGELLSDIRGGKYDEVDVIHFPVYVGDNERCMQWGAIGTFSIEQIKEQNMIPHGCFFRREVFDKLEGYRVDCYADWNFWRRAKESGLRFKGFVKPVYFFRQSERSATKQMLKELGGHENAKRAACQ